MKPTDNWYYIDNDFLTSSNAVMVFITFIEYNALANFLDLVIEIRNVSHHENEIIY